MGNKLVWVLGGLVLFAFSLWVLQIGLLGYFVLITLIDFLWRYKIAGSITLTELKQLHGQKRVAIADVKEVTGRFWRNALTPNNVILDVITADKRMVITVHERGILSLFRAGLGTWVIGTAAFFRSKNLFSIKPCEPGISKRIEYDTVGRYAFSPDTILFSILFIVLGSNVVYSVGLINV